MPRTYDLEEVERQVPDWLHELESGCYDQTSGVLRDEAGYCCFGVADMVIFGESFAFTQGAWADSAGDTEMLSQDKLSLLGFTVQASDTDIEAFHAALRPRYEEPDAARLRATLCTDDEGESTRPARSHVLAALNDASVPFEEIASFIRESGWFSHLPNTTKEE